VLRSTAAAGFVLTRNDDSLLPLDPRSLGRVAVLGPNDAAPRTPGGGSATVVSPFVTGASGVLVPFPVARGQLRDRREVPSGGEPMVAVRLADRPIACAPMMGTRCQTVGRPR